MKPTQSYACLYAREFPAQALLRMRPEARRQPVAVMEGEPPLERVCSANARARALGVASGMTRVEIETIPGLTGLARSSAEEASARAAVLECAGLFSPRLEDCSLGTALICVLDITGTEKLFGSPATLARRLLANVRKLGVSACVAVSANFHASVALAQGIPSVNQAMVVPKGDEASALAPLPLSVLALPPERAETFTHWGIHTLGMLAALPETALIARLGQEGKRLRLLARGELPHLFLPLEPVFALEERMELESPVEILESLLFCVSAMLQQLLLRATDRALALATVTLTLAQEGGAKHTRTVRPALPMTDRQLWLKLLHLDLEAHPPGAAILGLTLTAEPGAVGKQQLGLFSPQTPEASRLDITLARIRAIVGEHAVGRALLADTHRPDAFRLEPFTLPTGRPSPVSPATQPAPLRAVLRQLRPAESLAVSLRDGRPESFFFRGSRYDVARAYGPWLAGGEWWSRTRWALEQWDVVAHSGDSMLCGCIVHQPAQPSAHARWTLAALYD